MDYNKKKEQDTWDEDEPDCPNRWMLQGFVVNTGSDISSTANVSLRYNGDGMETVAFGMGPIDAAFHAIENLVQSGALTEEIGQALLAALGDKALGAVPRESRDQVRADIMKQVLILQV